MLQTILLVEDNQTDIGLIRRAMTKSHAHCDLVVKEDGQEALDFLFGQPGSAGVAEKRLPALIILDLKMPRIVGFEVLRQIRHDSRTRHVPVVIFTSSGEEQDIAEAYELGANSYIRKPVDFKLLSEAIDLIAKYWLIFNKSADHRKI